MSDGKSMRLTYLRTWKNAGGAEIDYYEIELKSLTKQIYPNLPATPMMGFDGMVPGPTFVMQQGRGKYQDRGTYKDLANKTL